MGGTDIRLLNQRSKPNDQQLIRVITLRAIRRLQRQEHTNRSSAYSRRTAVERMQARIQDMFIYNQCMKGFCIRMRFHLCRVRQLFPYAMDVPPNQMS